MVSGVNEDVASVSTLSLHDGNEKESKQYFLGEDI